MISNAGNNAHLNSKTQNKKENFDAFEVKIET